MTRYEFLKLFRDKVEDGVAGDVDLDSGDLRFMQDVFDEVRAVAQDEDTDSGIDDGVYEDSDPDYDTFMDVEDDDEE